MKKVMAFGTFDVLHKGHEFYLKKAKEFADQLIVVVARDCNVEKVKGKKPLHSEQQRLAAVGKIDFVDTAILGDEELHSRGVIKKHSPDVIALGYDQWPKIADLKKELEEKGLSPEIVRIPAYQEGKFKSSLLKKQIK